MKIISLMQTRSFYQTTSLLTQNICSNGNNLLIKSYLGQWTPKIQVQGCNICKSSPTIDIRTHTNHFPTSLICQGYMSEIEKQEPITNQTTYTKLKPCPPQGKRKNLSRNKITHERTR